MPASNNFLQHNPGQANQETDPAYAADNIRNSGLGTDDIVPSPWMNKVLFQTSTMCAALAQMMANKGFAMSDSNFNTLVNTLANILTDADIKPPLISVPFSASPIFDASQANGFDMVLGGNVASSNLINVAIGQIITFVITQGAVTYSFTPPANVNGWQPINTAPNSVTTQSFIRDIAGNIVPYSAQQFANNYMSNPMTTLGDLIYALAGGVATRLGIGGNGQILTVAGGIPSWQNNNALSNPMTALGDLITSGNSSGAPVRLPLGSIGQVLTVSGSFPAWETPSNGFSHGSGPNGYWEQGPSNRITQWGTHYADINNSQVFIQFPINFSNAASISVVVTTYSVNDRITYVVYPSVSVNGFTIANNGSSGYAMWQAIGY